MLRDNGLISAVVVCLVLPSMAGMWWRYSLDPALHASPASNSSITQIQSEPPVNTPPAPAQKKPVKRPVAVAGIGFVPLGPEVAQDELGSSDGLEPWTAPTQDEADSTAQ